MANYDYVELKLLKLKISKSSERLSLVKVTIQQHEHYRN